jgi:hypothetical protein
VEKMGKKGKKRDVTQAFAMLGALAWQATG